MSELDKDEQFYRDTESIAFPNLDDRQLAMLEPLGTWRILRRGELIFKAGEKRSFFQKGRHMHSISDPNISER